MKCPKCQREHTLKRAENNTVVCAACGSRFPLKTPAQAAAKPTQPPSAAPKSPTANVDDKTLAALFDGVKRVDDAPAPPNDETTYSLRSEPAPPVPPTLFQDHPFDRRGAAETSNNSTPRAPAPDAQTSNKEDRPSLFSWSGRATQREFLGAVGYYLLYSLLLGIVLGVLFGLLGALSAADSDALRVVAGLGMLVVGLAGAAGCVAVTIILLAASARRLRDAGLSPYLTLLHFVVSLPLTIFLAVYPGQTKQAVAPQPEPRPQTPENPRSTATPAPATATLGWRRFFSWNAPARPTDLPVALGLYAATTVWLFLHLTADAYVMNEILQEFSFDSILYNFADLVSDTLKLAIYLFNLSWLYASSLAAIKIFRK